MGGMGFGATDGAALGSVRTGAIETSFLGPARHGALGEPVNGLGFAGMGARLMEREGSLQRP